MRFFSQKALGLLAILQQSFISSSHLENAKATILFGESGSTPVDKMQLSLLLGKAKENLY